MPLRMVGARAAQLSGTGSNLVGTDHLSVEFIDVLRARSVVLSSGARMLNGLEGNVVIPKLTGSASAGWIA